MVCFLKLFHRSASRPFFCGEESSCGLTYRVMSCLLDSGEISICGHDPTGTVLSAQDFDLFPDGNLGDPYGAS